MENVLRKKRYWRPKFSLGDILVKMCHWHWHWKICGEENKSSMTKTEICWRENKSLMTKAKICLLRHWHTTSAPLAFLLTPLASAAVVNVKFYCKHNFPKSKYLQYFSFYQNQQKWSLLWNIPFLTRYPGHEVDHLYQSLQLPLLVQQGNSESELPSFRNMFEHNQIPILLSYFRLSVQIHVQARWKKFDFSQ